jgi:hypothetical protein
VSDFGWERIADAIARLYDEVAARRTQRLASTP